jgi:hypothetical protein
MSKSRLAPYTVRLYNSYPLHIKEKVIQRIVELTCFSLEQVNSLIECSLIKDPLKFKNELENSSRMLKELLNV